MEDKLPDLVLGTDLHTKKEVKILAQHRSRGIMVVGQPGTGKSTLTNKLCLQDIQAGNSVFYMEPHEGIVGLLPQIPENRKKDVVLLTLRTKNSPLWPVLDVARNEDERSLVGDLLVDTWQAQYGKESVGPRAASILRHALLTLPEKLGASPLELMAVLSSFDYRFKLLSFLSAAKDYPLQMYWNESMRTLGEARLQDWSQAVANKLDPLLSNTWLRLATCGVPAIQAHYDDQLHPFKEFHGTPIDVLWRDPQTTGLESVTWLRDGVLSLRFKGKEVSEIATFDHELDQFLVQHRDGRTVYTRFFGGDGVAVDIDDYPIDQGDPLIAQPSESDIEQFGLTVQQDVDRRRRRRAWTRLSDLVLRPAGVQMREVLDIGDLLDDRKIVLVEVPEIFGTEVTTLTATFAFLSAVLRGNRQLSLPPNRRAPCAIYIDEASLFLSEGIERVLAELRKADVGLTIVLQRFGQLGQMNSVFRRGVVDTIGSIITLPVGIQEVGDVSSMFENEDSSQVHALRRSHGLLMSLTPDGALMEHAQAFHFDGPSTLTPEQAQLALEIRRASVSRYYHSRESAEAVFAQRVANIRSYSISTNGDDDENPKSKRNRRRTPPPAPSPSSANSMVPRFDDDDEPPVPPFDAEDAEFDVMGPPSENDFPDDQEQEAYYSGWDEQE